jgi:hypothetical protein
LRAGMGLLVVLSASAAVLVSVVERDSKRHLAEPLAQEAA